MKHLYAIVICACGMLAIPVGAASDSLGITLRIDVDAGPHYIDRPLALHATLTNTSSFDGVRFPYDFTWLDRHEDGSTTRDLAIKENFSIVAPQPILAGETQHFDITRTACDEPIPCRMHFAVEFSGSLQQQQRWTVDSNDVDVVVERDPTATFRDQPNENRAIVSVADADPVTFSARETRLKFEIPAGRDLTQAIASTATDAFDLHVIDRGSDKRNAHHYAVLDIDTPSDPATVDALGRDIARATDPAIAFAEAIPVFSCDDENRALDENRSEVERRVKRLSTFVGTGIDRQNVGLTFRIDRPPQAYQTSCYDPHFSDFMSTQQSHTAIVSATAHTDRAAAFPATTQGRDLDAFASAPDARFASRWTILGDRPELLAYAPASESEANERGLDVDVFALTSAQRYAAIAANALDLRLEHPSLIAAIPDEASAQARTVALAETFAAPGSLTAIQIGAPQPPPPAPSPIPEPPDLRATPELYGSPIAIGPHSFAFFGTATAAVRTAVDEPCADAIGRATRDAAFAAMSNVRNTNQSWLDGAHLVLVTTYAPLASPTACTSDSSHAVSRRERISVTLELTYRLAGS